MSAIVPHNSQCPNRVKPTLLRDIKTEAVLVFARTALERYFAALQRADLTIELGSLEESKYLYDTLKKLLDNLQESVVNVDYLLEVSQNAARFAPLRALAKKEESLMCYYDVMAQKVRGHFKAEQAYLPELLVIGVLEEWLLGEEKSTHLYPFLEDIDFLELIAVFENNRKYFEKEGYCKVSELLNLSSSVVEKLKEYKYKVNSSRVSKTRKPKRK